MTTATKRIMMINPLKAELKDNPAYRLSIGATTTHFSREILEREMETFAVVPIPINVSISVSINNGTQSINSGPLFAGKLSFPL